jgi:Lipid A core - O-antigen ligase and related enzymes
MANTYKTVRLFYAFLFLYLVFGLHVFMHNQGGAGLYLPFNMVGWAFVSVLISIGVWHITSVKKISYSHGFKFYVAGFLVLLIPFLNPLADWSQIGQLRFYGLMAGIFLFLSFSQFQFDKNERNVILYFLLLAVAIESLLGLVQFFVLKDGNWIGYNTKINRPYGIFQKDSVFSSFLAVGLAIAFYQTRWDESLSFSRWRKILLGFIFISVPLLLVQIQSRAGIYGAVLVTIFMLPIMWSFNRRYSGSIICLLLIGLGLGMGLYHPMRDANSYMVTTNFRKLYWSHSLSMWLKHPWFGYGYGSFEYTFLHGFYAPENIKPGMALMEENLDHPHNEIIFWLYEGGIVAIIGLVFFAVGYISSLVKCTGWAKRISLVALVLPLLFHSMVEYPFYHSVAHFFFFVVFLWLADAESGQQKTVVCNYWFLARFIAILIPMIVVPFMLTGLQEAYLLTKYERMKDKNPQMLEQIINPLPWMMMYEFEMRNVQLTFSAAMHDKAGLESYVTWAKQFLHNSPRAVVYGQLVYALQQLNEKTQAQFWLDEGKRLFPHADFLQRISLTSNTVMTGTK